MDHVDLGYHSVGQKMAAQVDLLYLDIARLVRRDSSLTPAKVAALADLSSEWVVRDIRKPDWFVKNVAQLFKIEAALSQHPDWHPKTILDEAYTSSPEITVYRRWVDPYETPDFQELALRWSVRRSDRQFIEEAKTDPWVSTVDVSSGDRWRYRILEYNSEIPRRYGVDKSGQILGAHPFSAYAEMTTGDFHQAAIDNGPRCRDVVYTSIATKDRGIYRSLLLPCLDEGIVVSRLVREYCTVGRDRLRRSILDAPNRASPNTAAKVR
jgi:hypothetical protein